MGLPGTYDYYKLIIGVLKQPGVDSRKIIDAIESAYGKTDFVSHELPFTFTNYYAPEMGERIIRFFVTVQELVLPDRLAEFKELSNNLEKQFMNEKDRSVNFDPGIMNLSRFILATTKDNAHRIPLRNGMFAEITLMYEGKEFRALPWTYPDYSSNEYVKILEEIRKNYKIQLKQH